MKKKKRLILSCLLALLCTGMAQADPTACIYVQKSGTAVEAVGSLGVTVGSSDSYTLAFDSDGNAIMTVGSGSTAVAKITTAELSNGGELCGDFSSTPTNVSKEVSDGYATIYSPFQLVIPTAANVGTQVEAYAPTYDSDKSVLEFPNTQKYEAGATIPAGTPLVLKNDGTYEFEFSTGTPASAKTNALSGTAVKIATSSLGLSSSQTLYIMATLNNNCGFYKYTGTNLGAGKAYLVLPVSSGNAKPVYFAFDDEPTAVESVDAVKPVITDGKAYNLAGQRVNNNAKGIIIINGKKILNK